MRKISFVLLAVLWTVTLSAQSKLTAEEQRYLTEDAIKTVERFQQNCQLIAGSSKTYDEKVRRKGVIDVTMQDFVSYDSPQDGPFIVITNKNGQKQGRGKLVREYLKRLARLKRDIYSEITIESYDFGMAESFERDPNRTDGEWYVGYVTVKQRFIGRKFENVVYEDVVERKAKVYATREEYRIGNKKNKRWRILIDDINARNID